MSWRTPGGIVVAEEAVTWRATRSGGPGGQHANTSDTAVELTVELAAAGLPPALTDRLVAALGPVVRAVAADTRSQWRNRELAWERLAARLDAHARPPRPRRATRPTRGAVEARLASKRRQAQRKQDRQRPPGD